MTLLSKPSRQNSGFTLFEALVSLALIALVLAIGMTAARPPSPTLQAMANVARLNEAAAQARFDAITTAQTVIWEPDASRCPEDKPVSIAFFADGTASGADICVSDVSYRVHPLTGILSEVSDE